MRDVDKDKAQLIEELPSMRRMRLDNEHFRVIIENSQAIIFIIGADGKFQLSEGAPLAALGLKPGEAVGQSAFEMYADFPEIIKGIRAAFAGQNYADEVDVGGVFFDIFYTPHRDANGDVLVLGMAIDITERKRAVAAQRESEERLQAVFDSAADYLLLLDRDQRVQMVNRIAPGLTREQVIGASFCDFAVPERRESLKAELAQVVARSEKHQWDEAHVWPDGSMVHLSTNAAPVIVAGKVAGIVVCSRDVTDRVRLETEKKQLEEQYQQAQKMEAVGRLAGGVAHDFNNVLCAITGNADYALLKLSADDPARQPIGEIAAAAKRAADLTAQLLAFSRKQLIAPKVVDLGELIESQRSMLGRLIREDIRLRIASQKQLGRIRADPGQIEQVVLNLVVNARDAMPDGGELVIEMANVVSDGECCVKHPMTLTGDHVMLSVSDNGCGMTAEVREKIFEPFFTTKALGQGTGLGLATVFGIVEQNGGKIDVESEPGVGSCFKLYFPLVVAEADDLTPAVEAELRGGQETVLVVEDDEMVRGLAARLLGSLGYELLAAGSVGDAIAMAERHEGPIDLLLTDVVMPRMNGRQLAARVIELRPEIEVLYTSGYAEEVIAHHGVLDEGVHFLAKPYSLATLAARVRQVLDHAKAK